MQVTRQQRRQDAERERAEHAVAERLLLIGARQPEDQDREHQRVVGAEQPFEQDEQADGEEICERERPFRYRPALTRRRIKVYIWIDAGSRRHATGPAGLEARAVTYGDRT